MTDAIKFMKALFVTGTDTEIGKTFVTAGMALALKEEGIDVGYMKPVASGCIEKGGRVLSPDLLFIRDLLSLKDDPALVTPYPLVKPLAPSIASRMEGVRIDPGRIEEAFGRLSELHPFLLVEGVGGVMTPICREMTVLDLIARLQLPALLVVGARLGAINHTLLSILALERGDIPFIGVVINRFSPEWDESVETLKDELQGLGIRVLGEVPYLEEGIAPEVFKPMVKAIQKEVRDDRLLSRP